MDDIDRAILIQLQRNGRIPNNELADLVGLSPSPCLRRVRNLESAGVISGYTAVLDRAEASDALANVTPYRRATVRVPGLDMEHDAVDLVTGNLPALRGVHADSGSLSALGPGRALVSGWLAGDLRLRSLVWTELDTHLRTGLTVGMARTAADVGHQLAVGIGGVSQRHKR